MEEKYRKACEEIAKAIISGEIKDRDQLNRFKVKIARKYHLSKLPTIQIFSG